MKQFKDFSGKELQNYFAGRVKDLILDYGQSINSEQYSHIVLRLTQTFTKRGNFTPFHFEKAENELLNNKPLYREISVASILTAFYNANER